VSEGRRRGGDLPLTRALASRQSIQGSGRGRGHIALERGVDAPEGARSPRTRRRCARGGA
jgi:hypothetical protein